MLQKKLFTDNSLENTTMAIRIHGRHHLNQYNRHLLIVCYIYIGTVLNTKSYRDNEKSHLGKDHL